MAAPCKKRLVKTTLFIDRPFIMTCIWRIHGSKPYIFRWSLVYNTSVFCFSHFHLEGWVGGLSQMKLTSFEKNCHILRRCLTWTIFQNSQHLYSLYKYSKNVKYFSLYFLFSCPDLCLDTVAWSE